MNKFTEKKQHHTTAVLQDLGGSDKSKSRCVFGIDREKIKNWEGFPQTLQSHKTLANSFVGMGKETTKKVNCYRY